MSDRTKLGRAEARANRVIWNRLPIDLPRGRMVLELVRAAGGDAWFSSPDTIELDAPRDLPKKLLGLLFLHGFLNAKAIAEIEEEGSAP